MCLLVLERRLNDPRWPKDAKQFDYVQHPNMPLEFRVPWSPPLMDFASFMARSAAERGNAVRIETIVFRRVGTLADDIGRYMQEG